MTVGLLHPGEMGSAIGATLAAQGEAVIWASVGRSPATAERAKRAGLEGYGLSIAERVPLETFPTPHNLQYLRAKKEKLGHLLDELGEPEPEAERT